MGLIGILKDESEGGVGEVLLGDAMAIYTHFS
jgi:hypothetical protein